MELPGEFSYARHSSPSLYPDEQVSPKISPHITLRWSGSLYFIIHCRDGPLCHAYTPVLKRTVSGVRENLCYWTLGIQTDSCPSTYEWILHAKSDSASPSFKWNLQKYIKAHFFRISQTFCHSGSNSTAQQDVFRMFCFCQLSTILKCRIPSDLNHVENCIGLNCFLQLLHEADKGQQEKQI